MLLAANSIDSSIGQQHQNYLNLPTDSPDEPEIRANGKSRLNGYAHWKAARDTGAHLLWRCVGNRQLPVIKALDDGSYLSVIYPSTKSRRSRAGEITVRVIEYALPGVPDAHARYRLLSTLLDPTQAPALELAALYHERWEVEAVFDELKMHLVQRRRTLRSKTPNGVRQEFYGWVLAHYAVCWLMHQAASTHRLQLRSLSFTSHVHLLRRAQLRSGTFPPSAPPDCGNAGSQTCCARQLHSEARVAEGA